MKKTSSTAWIALAVLASFSARAGETESPSAKYLGALDRSGCLRDPNYFVRISKGWFEARDDIRVNPGDLVFCVAFNRTYAHPE